MQESESWSLTILRGHGLQFLRAEKNWRPIITAVVDDHKHHEVTLGCDGQNPNLKIPFVFTAHHSSLLHIKVWHCPHNHRKKSGRRRTLVGSVRHSLDDLVKKQGSASNVELHLSCPQPQRRLRGKAQKVTHLRVKLCPLYELRPSLLPYESGDEFYSSSAAPSPSASTSELPWQDENPGNDIVEGDKTKKPRIRGYLESGEDYDSSEDSLSLYQGDECKDSITDQTDGTRCSVMSVEDGDCTSAMPDCDMSMLPSYTEVTERISMESSVSAAQWMLDAVSPYQDFRQAQEGSTDSDWERILHRVQTEWYYMGGSLVSLAALNASVFGFSSGTLFTVDGLAQRALAVGSIAAGIGVFVDAWFIFSYSGADAAKFKRKARDVFGTYLFFCISSRLPALCLLVSATALLIFLIAVAYSVWPTAALFIITISGVILSLQFLSYGVYRLVQLVINCVKMVARGLRHLLKPRPASGPETEGGPSCSVGEPKATTGA